MIELLYNAVKAVGGEDINIIADITDADGNDITSGCSIVFIDKEHNTIAEYDGTYADGEWTFTIPAATTKGLGGRYWYQVVAGSFSVKENAEKRVQELKEAGFRSFIQVKK